MTHDVAAIMASTTYRDAVAVLDRDHDRIIDDIIRLTEIPSPPFGEDVRGDAYLRIPTKAATYSNLIAATIPI